VDASPNPCYSFYREIFLNPIAGTYKRNLFDDFSSIPDFNPDGAGVAFIQFQIDEHGWGEIDNIVIGTNGGTDTDDDDVGAMPWIPLLLLDTEIFTLESSSFSHAQPIPSKHSLNGNNLSPPLSWRNAPANTQSFVLIMDDPDAPGGTWDHWIVYDIPGGTTFLAENAGASGGGNLPPGAKHGTNSWSNNYYQGPLPPSGTHRYYFKLYALSTSQLNPSGTSKAAIEAAMQGKILKQTELMGTYTHTP
jgi:hypothetical protein